MEKGLASTARSMMRHSQPVAVAAPLVSSSFGEYKNMHLMVRAGETIR
jgi:hypothetical protein